MPCLQVLLLTPDNAWAERAIAVPSPEAESLSGAAAQAGDVSLREKGCRWVCSLLYLMDDAGHPSLIPVGWLYGCGASR